MPFCLLCAIPFICICTRAVWVFNIWLLYFWSFCWFVLSFTREWKLHCIYKFSTQNFRKFQPRYSYKISVYSYREKGCATWFVRDVNVISPEFSANLPWIGKHNLFLSAMKQNPLFISRRFTNFCRYRLGLSKSEIAVDWDFCTTKSRSGKVKKCAKDLMCS